MVHMMGSIEKTAFPQDQQVAPANLSPFLKKNHCKKGRIFFSSFSFLPKKDNANYS